MVVLILLHGVPNANHNSGSTSCCGKSSCRLSMSGVATTYRLVVVTLAENHASGLLKNFLVGMTTHSIPLTLTAICRTIIEAHGGQLWASSGISHGSVFNFQLPAFRAGVG